MYHYIPYHAGGGGRLLRAPADIREELGEIRGLLRETEQKIEETEGRRAALTALLGGAREASPHLVALSEVVEESERLKRRMEGLWERTDALGEELSDTLLLLRGCSV